MNAADITVAVRMGMGVQEAHVLAELLPRCPQDVRDQVHEQLWLRCVFTEQRRRTNVAERAAFDARADRILAHLDPQEQS